MTGTVFRAVQFEAVVATDRWAIALQQRPFQHGVPGVRCFGRGR